MGIIAVIVIVAVIWVYYQDYREKKEKSQKGYISKQHSPGKYFTLSFEEVLEMIVIRLPYMANAVSRSSREVHG